MSIVGMDRKPEYRFQQLEKRIDNKTMSRTLQRQQRKYRHNRRMHHHGLGIALWQRQNNGELKAIAYASRYLNDAETKTIQR